MDSIAQTRIQQLFDEQRQQFMAELDDHDYAGLLFPEFDYRAQLTAIEALLRRNTDADRALSEEIRKSEMYAQRASGPYSYRAEDEWVERLHASVYQDAAHSMAAVGMLAPFLESLLHHTFTNLRSEWGSRRGTPPHPRFHQQKDKIAWDCHYYWTGHAFKKDIIRGTKEIADTVNLTPRLPQEFWKIMEALFAYRNKMFHSGFEWPRDERRNFAARIGRDWDSSWFASATSGEEPWIFYLSETFIARTLGIVEPVVLAIGLFARELFIEQQGAD
jgi:hypothetical protein